MSLNYHEILKYADSLERELTLANERHVRDNETIQLLVAMNRYLKIYTPQEYAEVQRKNNKSRV